MHIKSVADDTDSHFPWPMMVYSTRGIQLRDVFLAISENFAQYVAVEEFSRWSAERKGCARGAYYRRVAGEGEGEERVDAGLRRVDYMGGRVLFRGLEASPEKDGTWVLFLGPM
jgi:hypothetical protein